MQKYEIFVEEAEETDILEKNYQDLLFSIIIVCAGEVLKDEQSNNIS